MALAKTFTKSAPRASDAGPSVLGASVRIRGRVQGEGDVTIEGTLEGTLSVSGELVVAEGASIHASEAIVAATASIGGSVEGGVVAQGPIRLAPTARVHGDLKGSEISIDEGAEFSGRIDAEFELPAALAKKGR
jgi:cytoskeletal protein CcmA (bactofilin family)